MCRAPLIALLLLLPGVAFAGSGAVDLVQIPAGIGVTSVLKAEPWLEEASATPGRADDAFLDLMDFVYGGPHPPHARPWAIWDQRNWDYGGCSALGTGVVVEGLTRADAALATGPGFEAPIGEVRADALRAILKDNPMFPYCDGTTFEPTPDEALRDEVRQILKSVPLTDGEKKLLEARIPQLKGARFTGG